MVVVSADMRFRFSGGASNAVPAAALGGVRSSVGITSSVLENLFDNVSPAEATSGDTEYRCIYVYNANATDTLNAAKFWADGNTLDTETALTFGLDPAGIGNGTSTGVATTIANESTAPAGVTFSVADTEGAALAIGNLGPLSGIAVWCKRVVNAAAAAFSNDGTTLKIKGTPV